MARLVQLFLILALVSCSKEAHVDNEIQQKLLLMAQGEERQDPDLIVSLFANDAILNNLSSNDMRDGKEDILAYYKGHLHERETAKVTLTTKSITFKEPATATAIGKIELTFPSGENEGVAFKGEFQKGDTGWVLTKWTELNLFAPVSSYEQLKGLEWLVGSWTSSDEDSTFTTRNLWDAYKNFLTQTFSMNVLGQKELFGRQIIGWDPKEQKIRSWIFDSEGGFGQGSWFQDGDSWYVTVNYTMPDGSQANSTQIFKKVDDTHYQFSSTNRDIDGEILPNIGPCSLTKQP